MKTSRTIFLLLCLAGCITMEAAAQGYLPAFHIRIHSGFTIPAAPSEFNRYYGMGPNVGGVVSYRLDSPWEFSVSGHWSGFDLAERRIVDDYNLTGRLQEINTGTGDATMMAGFAEARYNWQFKPRNSFYAVGGVGFRSWSRDSVSVVYTTGDPDVPTERRRILDEQKETKPAVMAGVGATATLARLVHFFAEVQYDVTFTEETLHTFPIKAGLLIYLTR